MTVKLKSAGAGGARPRRARARVALALTLALAPAAPAWAQKPSLGFGLGLASVPRMVAPDCHGGRTGVVAGGSADVRLAVPVARRLALEGRVGGYVPFDFAECALWVVAPPPAALPAWACCAGRCAPSTRRSPG